jgi:hypothetical protein
MAKQEAIQDNNKVSALIAHTGTAGTAETVRLVASSAGALSVDLVGGDTINIGTVSLGTIKTINSLAPYVYDSITATYGTAGTSEEYAYKLGTANLGTLTVNYTDSTKGSISSVVKTP